MGARIIRPVGLLTWVNGGIRSLVEAGASAHARAAARGPDGVPSGSTVATVTAEREAGGQLADALFASRGDRLTEALLAGGRRSVAQLDPTFFQTNVSRTPSSLPRPFAQHAGLYGIVNKLASFASSAPWQIGRWDEKGAFRPDEQAEVAKLFARPNRVLSEGDFFYLLAAYLWLFGEAFVLLDRENPAELPTHMGVIPGGRAWAPVMGADRMPSAWVWKNQGEQIPFELYQVVHFRLPNPYNSLRGLAPAEVAAVPVERDVLADKHEKSLLENGAMPGGVIQFPKDVELTADQYEALKKKWGDRHQGPSKAGRFAILDNGGQFTFPEQTLADLQFMESRQYTLEQLCMIFGVEKWFIGLSDQLPYANAREARQAVWEDVLIPFLDRIGDTFNGQFLQFLPGQSVGRFNVADVPAMKAARRARIDDMLKLLQARVSLKQASKQVDIDLEPEPGWDEPWVGMGIAPISAAMVGEPLAPATLPETDAEPDEDEDAETEAEEPGESDKLEALSGAHTLRFPRGQRAAADLRRQAWRRWNRLVLEKGQRGYLSAVRPWLRNLATEIERTFEKLAKAAERGARESDFGPDALKTLADGNLFDLAAANREVITSLRPFAFEVAELSSAFTAGELGDWTEIDLTADAVQDFLNQRMALLSDARGGIAANTKKRLAKSMQRGLAKNETIAELRTRIQEFGRALGDPARALTIARTESAVVANATRMLAAQEHAAGWIWQTSDDEVVRASHVQAEAETSRSPVPMGGTVTLASGADMRFPGDPNGPAGEVINCFPAGTPVLTRRGDVPIEQVRCGDFVLTHRLRWRRVIERHVNVAGADVLEVTRDDGRTLRVTPTHKLYVLGKGWVEACRLERGDKLLDPMALATVNDAVGEVEHPHPELLEPRVAVRAQRTEFTEDLNPGVEVHQEQVHVVMHATRVHASAMAHAAPLRHEVALCVNTDPHGFEPQSHDDFARARRAAMTEPAVVRHARLHDVTRLRASRVIADPLRGDSRAPVTDGDVEQAHDLRQRALVAESQITEQVAEARLLGDVPSSQERLQRLPETALPPRHGVANRVQGVALPRAEASQLPAVRALRAQEYDPTALADQADHTALHSNVVRDVRAMPDRAPVFNLGVDEDMSYFAGGVLGRNCRCFPMLIPKEAA